MKIKHSPHVIWDVVDGETTLCQTDSGELFELTETGALIWSVCHENSFDAIIQHLQAAYSDVDPERLTADVEGFIETLERVSLLEVEQELSHG